MPKNNPSGLSISLQKFLKLDFCDGQVESVELKNGEVALGIKDWRERRIEACFTGVRFFKALHFGSDIAEVSLSHGSPEMEEVRKRLELEGDDPVVMARLRQLNVVHEFADIVIIFEDVHFLREGDEPTFWPAEI